MFMKMPIKRAPIVRADGTNLETPKYMSFHAATVSSEDLFRKAGTEG